MTEKEAWTLKRTRDDEGIELDVPVEIRCTEPDAIEYLERGTATLVKSPCSPPYQLLELLTQRVGLIQRLGPETNNPDDLHKIVDKIFIGSIRQNFVDGKSLNWRSGIIELRKLVGRYLSQCPCLECDLFFEFRLATFGGSTWSRGEFNSVADKTYGLELDRSAPVSIDSLSVRAAAVHVPGGSQEFTHKALTLQREFEKTIGLALSDGRVLVSQETPAGDRFVAPDAAKNLTQRELANGYHFLPSIELPATVLASNKPLQKIKRDARSWVEKICQNCLEQGRRPSQIDVKFVMQSKFEISENAAKEVIKEANWPEGWSSGRIPDDQKIDIKEIRDIN